MLEIFDVSVDSATSIYQTAILNVPDDDNTAASISELTKNSRVYLTL